MVKTVRRAFDGPGFDIEEEKKKGAFLVDALAIKPDERKQAWLGRYAAWAKKNSAHPYAMRHRWRSARDSGRERSCTVTIRRRSRPS